MRNKPEFLVPRRALLGASAAIVAMLSTPALAQGQAGAMGPNAGGQDSAFDAVDESGIIIRNDINPNQPPPAGNLDSGVTGVGQMIVLNQVAGTLGLCTGTLINPRTVIFAAHCVNTRPADAYGATTGNSPNSGPFGNLAGIPISFGFEATNRCQGVAVNGCAVGTGPYELWRDSGFQTIAGRHIYNVNQVWYDLRSLHPDSSGFLMGDIAIATLDTPAFNIPTWAMLFTPLDGPTNALQVGYGNRGNANSATIAIDYRRRAAENIISLLGSLDDRNQWLFGSGSVVNNLYMLSFSDPNPNYNPAAGRYDFGVFGGPSRGDAARPREGSTSGGDSGGPLIVEDRYDRQVVAGVLSGGSRFFAAQQFHNYGTHSFYQPLHAYWQAIVANNPYVYAGNKGGNGNWEDPDHWVQLMDPNYMIDVNGQLVNSLPNTPEEGVTGTGAKWGFICFLDDCTELDQAAPSGSGDYIVVPGGPGSVNFVPNNVDPNAVLGIRARYYDVTLSAPGTTALNSSVTIDRMTLDGQTRLDVRPAGTLNVLGEFNQYQGWTHVDGLIRSGHDAFFLTGLLSGSGTLKAPFTTVVSAIVAPAGADRIGTLTVDGNLIMASASALFVDANRNGADRLAVTGMLALDGPSLVMNKGPGAAPRHGDAFVIASAAGGVDGTFGQIYAFQGVLRPELSYGPNSVTATLRAGSLANQIGQSGPTERAFAQALDQLRGNYYNSLYGLYGMIDLMDPTSLSATLRNLAPLTVGETRTLQARQSRALLNNVADRLSSLGRGPTGRLDVRGSAAMADALATGRGLDSVSVRFHGLVPQGAGAALPAGMTGFASSGYVEAGSVGGGDRAGLGQGQRSWHVAMGLEIEAAPNLTIGSAFGYADGSAVPGSGGRSETRTTQAAAYGSYRLGGGAYVAGLASADLSRSHMQRSGIAPDHPATLIGAADTTRYGAMVEAGVNLDAWRGLTVTPRAALAYQSVHYAGFRERGGETALQLDDLRADELQARLGAELGGEMRLAGGWTFQPQLRGDFVRSLAGADAGMLVRFANAPELAFALPLAGGDRQWGELRGGLRLVNGNLSFGAGIETSIGRSDWTDRRAVADIALRF